MGESSKRLPVASALVDTERSPSSCLSEGELAGFARGELDAEARERAERHIDTCGPCAQLLDEAMHLVDSSAGADAERGGLAWVTTFRAGALVANRYEIRRFLARGGMGEVYEAYDRVLQARVALKTVSSSACDNQRAIRDLREEVKLALRVTHPNVCRIHGLGTHVLHEGAHLYFLTMEFVEGETLGKLIRKSGPLSVSEAQSFARALLYGLSAAHSAGILHRDFKSDNVIVRTGADGQRTPVILDFGLARNLDERSRARTTSRAFVGTLTYMAPEQVEGTSLSRATDIYAFGVVWFEMLTGKLPFRGSPQMSALERLSKPPAVPSQVNPAIPRALDSVLLRCLHRQPSERFETADAVLAAMPSLKNEVPSVAPRRRALGIAFGVVLVLAVSYWGLGQVLSTGQAGTLAREVDALSPDPLPAKSAQIRVDAARAEQAAPPKIRTLDLAPGPSGESQTSPDPAPFMKPGSVAPRTSGPPGPGSSLVAPDARGSVPAQSPLSPESTPRAGDEQADPEKVAPPSRAFSAPNPQPGAPAKPRKWDYVFPLPIPGGRSQGEASREAGPPQHP